MHQQAIPHLACLELTQSLLQSKYSAICRTIFRITEGAAELELLFKKKSKAVTGNLKIQAEGCSSNSLMHTFICLLFSTAEKTIPAHLTLFKLVEILNQMLYFIKNGNRNTRQPNKKLYT